ncbi:hypothetical protein HN011_000533 [Eciton burchellii]|nr:hypothetical protein HN011_000533 [Eciton burchellii]
MRPYPDWLSQAGTLNLAEWQFPKWKNSTMRDVTPRLFRCLPNFPNPVQLYVRIDYPFPTKSAGETCRIHVSYFTQYCGQAGAILPVLHRARHVTKTVMFARVPFFFSYGCRSGFELKRAAADLTSGPLGA